MKAEGHLGRCYLKGRAGDAANVILSAVGYDLRLVLAWLCASSYSRYSRSSQFGQFSNRLPNGRQGTGRLL
jgi:transposase, IS5 family